ncbi:hypothetical protein E2C01_052122 [Portunus trituberculatus]|uniref:Uncharacterized protein n=1 Tax=Portunus trituberculatus TaxID=210409 RepID=A0A5B7GLI9_PORTR|nr:hypothetical protein [Portunus trituberculatus]
MFRVSYLVFSGRMFQLNNNLPILDVTMAGKDHQPPNLGKRARTSSRVSSSRIWRHTSISGTPRGSRPSNSGQCRQWYSKVLLSAAPHKGQKEKCGTSGSPATSHTFL